MYLSTSSKFIGPVEVFGNSSPSLLFFFFFLVLSQRDLTSVPCNAALNISIHYSLHMLQPVAINLGQFCPLPPKDTSKCLKTFGIVTTKGFVMAIQWIEARHVPIHPAYTSPSPTTKNFPALNVHRGAVEKPCDLIQCK